MKRSTLLQQRANLNQIFDCIINSQNISEAKFDKMMKDWVQKNKALEAKEEFYNLYQGSDFNKHGYVTKGL
ncbi:hypothetical protein ACXGQW_00495 [Wenyingzhuangia sp. IMCC45533]